MTKLLFAIPLLLGAMAVIWMGFVFVGVNTLALSVIAVIGGVYSIGVAELLQFRRATLTLSKALLATKEKITALDEWLVNLDLSLQNSVRMRVEGERVGLPGPVLTPYLVGLLVMLGLMGTFVGMVYTLSGAVKALEGATEFQAVRAGLAAPIRGLGLAFGTSVAGVATSAMLGLMSTLCRRDRILETRRLDTKISTTFKDFSLVHGQRETFKAIQIQTQSLPDVVDKLCTMMDKIENLSVRLIENQDEFRDSVKSIYLELASSIDKSLKESISNSHRMASESIKPLIQDAMAIITEETQNVNNQLSVITKENLNELSRLFASQWQQTGERISFQQEKIIESLKDTTRELNSNSHTTMTCIFNEMTKQLKSHEDLICERIRNEESWLEKHGERMDAVTRFTGCIDSEISKFSKVSESFAISAVEMASLGDAFGTAVNLFNKSSENLIENLSRIEESLDRTSSRTDEQLGYYVAQAREIIDHSMMLQKEIFEELHKLRRKDDINLGGK